MILPILTSLIATGLGIFTVWLFNRKRQNDERTNQIFHIMNEISDIKNKMANGLERSVLETEKNEKFRDDVRYEVHKMKEDIEKMNGDIEKINLQVSENSNMILRLFSVVENLQNVVSDFQNLLRDYNPSRTQ